MHDQYKGRFEKEFWLRKIYILIVNINEISNSNIDLDNEMNIYRSKDEDYCIVTYLYYKDTFNKLGYKAKINTHTTSYIN